MGFFSDWIVLALNVISLQKGELHLSGGSVTQPLFEPPFPAVDINVDKVYSYTFLPPPSVCVCLWLSTFAHLQI